jgi:hypothetical protein
MPRPRLRIPLVALISILAPLCLSTPVSAEAIVLRSQDSRIREGRIVENGDVLRVREGRTVLLLLPDGATLEVQGPVRYRYTEATPAKATVIDAFAQMFRVRSDDTRLGGVRGDGAETQRCYAAPPADNWVDIAEDWTSGCRRRAVSRLDARLE